MFVWNLKKDYKILIQKQQYIIILCNFRHDVTFFMYVGKT